MKITKPMNSVKTKIQKMKTRTGNGTLLFLGNYLYQLLFLEGKQKRCAKAKHYRYMKQGIQDIIGTESRGISVGIVPIIPIIGTALNANEIGTALAKCPSLLKEYAGHTETFREIEGVALHMKKTFLHGADGLSLALLFPSEGLPKPYPSGVGEVSGVSVSYTLRHIYLVATGYFRNFFSEEGGQ